MTFTVKCVTPGQLRDHANASVDRGLRHALPFTVEVADSEPRASYDSICQCLGVYRLTDDAVAGLRKRGMFRQELNGRSNPVVCSCMGELQ